MQSQEERLRLYVEFACLLVPASAQRHITFMQAASEETGIGCKPQKHMCSIPVNRACHPADCGCKCIYLIVVMQAASGETFKRYNMQERISPCTCVRRLAVAWHLLQVHKAESLLYRRRQKRLAKAAKRKSTPAAEMSIPVNGVYPFSCLGVTSEAFSDALTEYTISNPHNTLKGETFCTTLCSFAVRTHATALTVLPGTLWLQHRAGDQSIQHAGRKCRFHCCICKTRSLGAGQVLKVAPHLMHASWNCSFLRCM